MMKTAVIFGVLLAATLVSTGCGNNGASAAQQANAAAPGTTKDASSSKNGQATAQGVSPKDLTLPPNGSTAQFGGRMSGGK